MGKNVIKQAKGKRRMGKKTDRREWGERVDRITVFALCQNCLRLPGKTKEIMFSSNF